MPTKRLVDGQPAVAEVVETGNVDLRLSTVETTRGGDITILGPGGSFIAGSVVRTDAQIDRRLTAYNVATEIDRTDLVAGNYAATLGTRGVIGSIPAGFEGVLTLRGGAIRGFTDGSFVLNQSRLFTQAGGDITLWSSNGDLNAGQGPKNASNFPPVVLRFTPNGTSRSRQRGLGLGRRHRRVQERAERSGRDDPPDRPGRHRRRRRCRGARLRQRVRRRRPCRQCRQLLGRRHDQRRAGAERDRGAPAAGERRRGRGERGQRGPERCR